MSPRCQELFGIAPEQLLEDPATLDLHPEDQQRFAAQWSYAAQPGGRLQFTGRMLGGQGRRWCTVLAQVQERPDGELLYTGVILDISERKRSEQALQDNERRFRSLAENLPGAIYRCLHDEERTMLYISDGVQRLTGYAGSDFIAGAERSLPDCIHPEDREPTAASIRESVARDNRYVYTYRILHPQRGERWVLDKGRGQRNEQDPDDVLWLDGLLLDVTEEVRVRQALQEAREAADKANRAKSEFLARMSHEIRTPMNAVLGMCHLTLQTELTPRQRDYQVKLERAAKALLSIINDILDFSKVEAGKMELESVPFLLQEVLDSLGDIVELPLLQKGLEFAIRTDPQVPRALQGDPLRLGQVLINLANNALKFTEHGFVHVEVGLESPPTEQGVVLRFTVRDSGIGLSPEQQERLFQSFTQANGSISRKYGGTGLGLAICKRLVGLMQGEIGVQSELGQGAAFSFTARFGIPAEEPLPRAADELAPGLAGIRGARVLVAEDNEFNQQIVRELLEQRGLVVTTAANGREALELADREPWDLVFMDIEMPELDGLEATRRLRAKGFAPPIVAMTAHALAEAREQCLQAGMNEHLSKPIDPQRLEAALVRWIPAKAPGERAPAPPVQVEAPAPSGTTAEGLPPLPGIDTRQGLTAVGGNLRLYRSLLAGFAVKHAGTMATLRGLLQSGDNAGGAALVHSLRGVAGNLGAGPLAEAAGNLERRLRALLPGETPDPDLPLLVELEGRLQEVLAGLTVLEEAQTGPATVSGPGPEELRRAAPLLRELWHNLEQDLGRAMQCLEELRPLLAGGQSAASFKTLERQLEGFDTDAARQSIEELARQLGISLEDA